MDRQKRNEEAAERGYEAWRSSSDPLELAAIKFARIPELFCSKEMLEDYRIEDLNFRKGTADREKYGPLPDNNTPHIEETSSNDDSDNSCDEISEETWEQVAEILEQEHMDAKKERKRQHELEQERARERERKEKREKEENERRKKNERRTELFALAEKIVSEEMTEEYLNKAFERYLLLCDKDDLRSETWRQSEEWEMIEIAGRIRWLIQQGKFTIKHFYLWHEDSKWHVSAEKAWEIINKQ